MNGSISDLYALTIAEEARRQPAQLERARLVAEARAAQPSTRTLTARLVHAIGLLIPALASA